MNFCFIGYCSRSLPIPFPFPLSIADCAVDFPEQYDSLPTTVETRPDLTIARPTEDTSNMVGPL